MKILATTFILGILFSFSGICYANSNNHVNRDSEENYMGHGVYKADSTHQANQVPIFQQLSTPNEQTKAKVVINQSPNIAYLVMNQYNTAKQEDKGFRIQLFSSNRGSKARTEAFDIEKELLEKNPKLEVYVIYESPFWKVRVGNCKTHELAQELRMWMIEEYPDYAAETYIVPSKILIPQK